MTAVADLLQGLLEATVATTAAVLLVLALRRPLRAAFGATVAYAAWTLVPVAAIAVLLPAATTPAMTVPLVQGLIATPLAMPATDATASIDDSLWWSLAWMLGMLLAMLWFARQQRGFRRGLGQLHCRPDGLQQADAIAGLPAAIGLWKPMIVLPADFDLRYSAEQRALMLAHERMHIARGDLQANAVAAVLRCVFWFHPLLHLAARHFRQDQELACDLRVIARHPQSRRAYGEAMLNTQLAAQPLPLGCHWLAFHHGRSHPLKERITMLKQPVPSLSRWLGGSAVVVALTLAAGVTAWAAQPSKPAVQVGMPTPPTPPVAPRPPAPPVAPRPPQAPDRMPPPPYPKQALQQHQSGMVMLLIDVGADGKPTAVQVERSEPTGVFDDAAVKAAKQWTFDPERKDGKPVAGRVRVPITFRAPKRTTPKTG